MATKSLNKNLRNASKAKKDEFYTQIVDIEKELKHYKEQFRGKVVYCNCDDPYESNFFKYFASNFNALGLKKLITTSYSGSPIVGGQLPLFQVAGSKGKQPLKIEIKEVPDTDKDGAINLDDVKYLLKHDKNTATPLKGSGDFRSEECIKLLKQADIVVTNPPFSLFREYLAQLIEYDKKFLIIGNINAITYKETFKLIKEGKMHVSPYHFNKTLNFEIPDSYENFSYINADGNKVAAVPAICWFTNLDSPARHEDLKLYKKYNKQEYPKYDNYKAIEVSKVANIPMDYLGVMGVPITFLGKHNPDQFEIVGLANDKRDVDPIFIKGTSTYLDDRHKSFVGMVLKGRAPYARI